MSAADDYAAIWKEHQRLQENADHLRGDLNETVNARNAAATTLEQKEKTGSPEEVQQAQSTLAHLDNRVNHIASDFYAAERAVEVHKAEVGPENAQKLSDGVKPDLPMTADLKETLASVVQGGADVINKTAAFVSDMENVANVTGIIAGLQGSPEGMPQVTQEQLMNPSAISKDIAAFQEQEQKGGGKDLLAGIDDAYKPPSKEDTNRVMDDYQKGLDVSDEAMRNGRSRDAPGPPPDDKAPIPAGAYETAAYDVSANAGFAEVSQSRAANDNIQIVPPPPLPPPVPANDNKAYANDNDPGMSR